MDEIISFTASFIDKERDRIKAADEASKHIFPIPPRVAGHICVKCHRLRVDNDPACICRSRSELTSDYMLPNPTLHQPVMVHAICMQCCSFVPMGNDHTC